MDLGIAGRVALVCGATKGIGRAIAAELVAEGADVAVASRDLDRAVATAEELGAAVGLQWDSDDPDGGRTLVQRVGVALGSPVEILVCNTGGPPAGEPLSFSRADWDAAYRSLVLAPLVLVDAVLPKMRERRFGRILNVSSTAVIEPLPWLMLSNVHRAGTLAGWKTLARDVAADNVTLNTILPGRIATDRISGMFGGDMDAAQEHAKGVVPAGRLGDPAELAAAAAFLCSARASYITGQSLAVDGGLLQSI